MNRLIVEKLSSPSKSSLVMPALVAAVPTHLPSTPQVTNENAPFIKADENSAQNQQIDSAILRDSIAMGVLNVLMEKNSLEQDNKYNAALEPLAGEIAILTDEVNTTKTAKPAEVARLMEAMQRRFIDTGLISQNPTTSELADLAEYLQSALLEHQDDSMNVSQEIVDCMEKNITAGMTIFGSSKDE